MPRYESPSVSPEPPTLEERIDTDVAEMNSKVRNCINALRRERNVTLTDDRLDAIFQRRNIIKDKLLFIKESTEKSATERKIERRKLLEEISGLLSFAEFQASQQQENEGRDGEKNFGELEGVSVEKDTNGLLSIWVEAPKESLMQFTYVSRNPEIARVLGVMNFEPNTVSSNMEGRFFASRWTDPKTGKHYFKIRPDEKFEGTFTIYINGKRKTVDINRQTEEDKAAQKARERARAGAPVERPETVRMNTLGAFNAVIAAKNKEITDKQEAATATKEAINELQGIIDFLRGPRKERAQKQLDELRAKVRKLEEWLETAKAALAVLTRSRAVYAEFVSSPAEMWRTVPGGGPEENGTEYALNKGNMLHRRVMAGTDYVVQWFNGTTWEPATGTRPTWFDALAINGR